MSDFSFEVPREDLLAGLETVLRFVPAKSTLPILSNILFQAKPGQLKLTATDTQVTISHLLTAQVEQPWATTLPAKLLTDYLAVLDGNSTVTVDLDTDRNRVHLVCGRFKANIAGLSADDFPVGIDPVEKSSFSLPSGMLREAIAHVAFAAAKDDARPVLACVMVRVSGQTLTLAAADGFRLAIQDLEMPDGGPEMSVLVPASTLSQVGRLLPDSDANTPVSIALLQTGRNVHFSFGNTELTTRIMEGEFPAYERIIPSVVNTTLKLSTKNLLQATRAASVFSRDNSMIVRIEYVPTRPNEVMVNSRSAEMGDHEARLEADGTGSETRIAFNGHYLRDALEGLDYGKVKVELTGSGQPGLIRPDKESGLLYVIMPMHVQAGA